MKLRGQIRNWAGLSWPRSAWGLVLVAGGPGMLHLDVLGCGFGSELEDGSSCGAGMSVASASAGCIYHVARAAGMPEHSMAGACAMASQPQKTPEQTRSIHPMVFQCWPSVEDAESTLNQHWVNAPCVCWV